MADTSKGTLDGGVATMGTAPGKHPIAPLPFGPTKLKGLSEKLIRSHHENNYGGAVKNLNKVEKELARVTKGTPTFFVGGLKERELLRAGDSPIPPALDDGSRSKDQIRRE